MAQKGKNQGKVPSLPADVGGLPGERVWGPKATEWESELGRDFPMRREQLSEDLQTLWGMEGKPKAGRPASTEMSCFENTTRGTEIHFPNQPSCLSESNGPAETLASSFFDSNRKFQTL